MNSIKPKTHRECHYNGCSKVFRKWKTTDKYCSPACKIADDGVVNIKPRSEKLESENKMYLKERKEFLNLLASQYVCPVMLMIKRKRLKPTEIHHMAGRKGKLLRYVPYWLAVSREGHQWIHDNPERAYELGFLIRSTTVNI